MAKSGLNRALTELRGTIDGFTYRRRPDGGLSIYTVRPSEQSPSAGQLSQRERFVLAQRYATAVLADPLRRAVYQNLAKKRKRPTNNLLVGNYLNPPVIETVELAHYTGQAEQEIGVVANDDIAVASVKIEIRGPGSTLLEIGRATLEHGVWIYRTLHTLPAGTVWRVDVTVINRAGHAAIASLPDPRNLAAFTSPSDGPRFRTEPPSE